MPSIQITTIGRMLEGTVERRRTDSSDGVTTTFQPATASHERAGLCLDHVALRAFDEANNFRTLSRGDVKVVQGSADVSHESGPVGLADLHALVGRLHVAASVIHRTSGNVTEKVDEELKFAAQSIFAAVGPEASQERVCH